jgi:hypothetical protein
MVFIGQVYLRQLCCLQRTTGGRKDRMKDEKRKIKKVCPRTALSNKFPSLYVPSISPKLTLVGSESNEALVIWTSKWRVYPSHHATMNDGFQGGPTAITASTFLWMPQTDTTLLPGVRVHQLGRRGFPQLLEERKCVQCIQHTGQ